jgi:DNA modification methylase
MSGDTRPFYESPTGDVALYQGDALEVLRTLPAESVHTVITSPPYPGALH